MQIKELYNNAKIINKTYDPTPYQTLSKLLEEVGELAQSINKYTSKDEILNESVDSIICIFSLLNIYDIKFNDIEDSMKEKMEKWRKIYS